MKKAKSWTRKFETPVPPQKNKQKTQPDYQNQFCQNSVT